MSFLTIPDTYYDNLRERLKHAKITVNEDMDTVRNVPQHIEHHKGFNFVIYWKTWKISLISFSLFVFGNLCKAGVRPSS